MFFRYWVDGVTDAIRNFEEIRNFTGFDEFRYE